MFHRDKFCKFIAIHKRLYSMKSCHLATRLAHASSLPPTLLYTTDPLACTTRAHIIIIMGSWKKYNMITAKFAVACSFEINLSNDK